MIEKALRFLVGLKENKTYEIGGIIYSDNELQQIVPATYYPTTLEVGSLDAIAKLIRAELPDYLESRDVPLFVRVDSPTAVSVFTRPDFKAKRKFIYGAYCKDANFKEGFRNQQEAIIELKSRFIPTADSIYLLDLISRINNEEGVKSEDNGVSQTITAKKGVSLMTTEQVKPRLSLQPFRTFREIPQPESEFILRLDDNGRVGLFEADGGIWKIEAKCQIQGFLEGELEKEIEAGQVVVMI